MHITSVRVEGFRSFLSAEVEFDPHFNVVVGRNGSGKSNLFEAIAFAIMCQPCPPQVRRAILHEGNERANKALVEVRIDNKDRRLNIDEDLVVIRRVIGPKGDGIFLQGKSIRRENWTALLETAGLSTSNPYYIVRQGTVNDLATCSDAKRLDVVRDLAGVNAFDDRRREALTQIEKGERLLLDAEENIAVLAGDIEELQGEQKSLKKYEKLDRRKRAIEYSLDQRRLKDCSIMMKKLDEEEKSLADRLGSLKTSLSSEQQELEVLNRKVEALEDAEKTLTVKASSLTESKSKEMIDLAAVEEQIKLSRADFVSSQKEQKEGVKAEQDLTALISEKEAALASVETKFQEATTLDKARETELRVLKQKYKGLYAYGVQQFRSDEERQEWIDAEKADLESCTTLEDERRESLQAEVDRVEQDREDLCQKREQQKQEQAEMSARKDEIRNQQAAANRAMAELQLEKQCLIKQRMDLVATLHTADEVAERGRLKLMANSGIRPLIVGMESMSQVYNYFLEKNDEEVAQGYFGTVAENICVTDPRLNRAASVTVGQKVFFLIVKTARLGTKMLSRMKTMKLPGEVHFLALDKLWIPPVEEYASNEARKLSDFINLKQEVDPRRHNDLNRVIQFLVGKVLVVKGPESFGHLQGLPFDLVTVEGDQASRKGVLKGGYYKPGASLLELYNNMCPQEATTTDGLTLPELDENISKLDNRHAKILNEEETCRTKLSRLPGWSALRSAMDLIDESEKEVAANLDRAMQALHQANISRAELEAKKDVLTRLTERREDPSMTQCLAMSNEIDALTRQYMTAFKKTNEILQEKNRLHTTLQMQLYPQLRHLQESLPNSSKLKQMRDKIEILGIKLTCGQKLLDSTREQLATTEDLLAKKKTALIKSKKKYDEQSTTVDKLKTEFSDASEKMRALLSKKNSTRAAAAKTTAFQGTIPDAEVKEVSGWSRKRQFAELKKIITRMDRDFPSINKQALDQFVEAKNALDSFVQRKEDILKDREALLELLDTLDEQRQNKVNFTYNQMAKYFSEIFKTLVPRGSANLNFDMPSASTPCTSSSSSSSSGRQQQQRQPDPVGLSITVRFNEREALTDLKSLSGGQKTITSLAFIFAIQKCDPSPFYILDEVDAALDVRGRKAIADMIHRDGAQFITTTFRPELLTHATKFHGIKFGNKVSHVESVTREDALDFVREEETV